MEDLPSEIIVHVIEFLDIKDLYHFGSCTKQFFNLFKSNDIWKKRLIDDFPFTLDHINNISDLVHMDCYNLLNTLVKRINKYVSTEEADVARLNFLNYRGRVWRPYVRGPPYEFSSLIGLCHRRNFRYIDIENYETRNGTRYLVNREGMSRDEANKYLRKRNYRECKDLDFATYGDECGLGIRLGLFL